MNNINEQEDRVKKELKKLEAMGGSLTGKAVNLRDSAFARFPVLFVLLSSFGVVATFYGFEKLIDRIPFFLDNPEMILVAGVGTLFITGTLYKKLN